MGPTYPGFIAVQSRTSAILSDFLDHGGSADDVLSRFDDMYTGKLVLTVTTRREHAARRAARRDFSAPFPPVSVAYLP